MENPQKKSPQDARTAALEGAGGTQYPPISSKSSRQKRSPRKEFIEQNRLRLGFERRLRSQLQSTFTRVGRDAASAYQRSGNVDTVSRGLTNRLADVLGSHYRAVIDAFGLRVIRDRKQDGQFEAIVRQYIRDVGGIRITQISNSTMRQINRVVNQGAQEGLGVAAIGKNIRDSLDGAFSRYRANTIARTETHSAASYANHQVNASLNIPNQMKRWVAVSDARARATHVAANGTEVPLDEDFIVGGVAMAYTGDPKGGAKNVINCRCVTLYIDPDDEVIQDEIEPVAQRRVVPQSPPEQAKPQERLTIGSLIVNKVSDKNRARFDDKINDNLSPLAMSAALNLPKPSQIKNSKRGFYQRERTLISSDLDSNTLEHEYGHHVDFMGSKTMKFLSVQDKGFQQAFIDDARALGLGTNGIDFDTQIGYRVTLNKDKLIELRDRISEQVTKTKTYTRGRRKGMSFEYTAWRPKFEGGNSISDIIDAMSGGEFFSDLHQFGHGRSYYRRSGSHYYETFANLFAIHGNKKALAEAKKLFPNTVREFERMLKELAEREGN